MAKKKAKLKLKPKKQTLRRWRRNHWVIGSFFIVLVILGFVGGVVTMRLVSYNQHPKDLVWAADKSVTIPKDLVSFLETRSDDCKGYRGTDSPTGVGIWAVYQVSHNKFAKISYGCSTNLTTYIMAVKTGKTWSLLQPTEYFSTVGFLAKCSEIERYQIDKSIEPFCIQDNGVARPNAVT